MKYSCKFNRLPLNANDNNFLNTKIDFTPEVFVYDEGKIPYEVMEVLCDYFHKLRMDYVSRAGVRNEKIKNEEPRNRAIKKQQEDLKNTEKKAQILLNWLHVARREDVPEPKGTKYIDRSPKSGLDTGVKVDLCEKNS